QNTLGTGPRNKSPHLFSRLVFRGKCGAQMRLVGSASANPNLPRRIYYRCQRRHDPSPCDQRPVRHDAVEYVFVTQLAKIVETPSFWDAAEKARAAHAKARPSNAEILQRMKAQKDSIMRRIDNLISALEDGELLAIIRPRLEALNKEKRKIEDEIRRLEREEEDARATSPDVTRAIMRNVAEAWKRMTVEEKREGIRVLVKRFVASGETMTIEWTDPNLPPAKATLPARWSTIKL